MKGRLWVMSLIAGCAGIAVAAHAQESYTAADLGKTLTPYGAIKAGNKDGSIPEWTGGIATPPAGYVPGQQYINPYAGEKPLFTITGANADQYADKLTPGMMAMLKQYSTFKMNVYPSHRSAAAPQYVYDAMIANATRAKLSEDGLNVSDSKIASPFPIPKNGNEAMINHVLRWRGLSISGVATTANPQPNGDYTLIQRLEKIYLPYGEPNSPDNQDSMYYGETIAPPRFAGELLLANSFTNPGVQERQAWTYNPGQRRVRRAPEINYDTPAAENDALRTIDDYDGFNGAVDRYTWKLLGRKEIYIPYNEYELMSSKYKYSDVVRPAHVNPDLVRWEPHRVWVVEGNVAPGKQHIYARRVFYIDEDSWAVVLSDKYDGRGQLWRVTQMHMVSFYDSPVTIGRPQEWNDLIGRRYAVYGMYNESTPPNYHEKYTRADFTPEVLRRAGVR